MTTDLDVTAQFQPFVGESIAAFAAHAPAQGTFNGVLLRASGQSAAEIVDTYKAAWERRRRKCWLSVHGRMEDAVMAARRRLTALVNLL